MKAVIVREFGPLGSAKVEEIATPQPAQDEVLVEVAAVAANFLDTLVMQGTYQSFPSARSSLASSRRAPFAQ